MKRPVFIVGCPRSGTTLLYSMLVAAGGFAVYRKETYFYDLVPRFAELATERSQQRFMRQFLGGYLGKVPGIDVQPFVRAALAECRTSRDFLPRLMTGIAAAQGVDRWVEATPAHVKYMNEIKQAVPDALFVHVIRDGRDCALSLSSQGWIPTFPWDAGRQLGAAALFWEWMVRKGQEFGRAHADDYCELRFEDLIAEPGRSLDQVGRFIDHDLAYDRIVQNPVHAMRVPNTSFREEHGHAAFNPVGRWRLTCTEQDVALCEELVGRCLEELGYGLARHTSPWRARLMRATYLRYFSLKHWLKAHTPVGRFTTSTKVWAEQPRAGEQPVHHAAEAPMRASS